MSHSSKILQESSPTNNFNTGDQGGPDSGTDCKEEMLEELPSAIDTELDTDPNEAENEGFFNMVSHAQRNRMDDQRCNLGWNETPAKKSILDPNKSDCERPINELLDMLADKQGQRLDDQRVTCDNLPGLQLSECYIQATCEEVEAE
ncbi:G-protein-signaling modulator 2 [Stegostoma tigrinum]|uniref:G-protein-signaling modulator 2 n=1 Tax=Stegostoma tigrinum TaxID=3053191 RepID=UPI00202AF99D|nr:G-protein-signaling modulator 2 [Stegostoma tigrinum]